MAELFWDDEFEWHEPDRLSDADYEALPIAEKVIQQQKLAFFLGAYTKRWVKVQNANVVTSGRTLKEVLQRPGDGYVFLVGDRDRKLQLPKAKAA